MYMVHAAGRPEVDIEGVLNPIHGQAQLYQYRAEGTTPWYGPQDDLGDDTGRGGRT